MSRFELLRSTAPPTRAAVDVRRLAAIADTHAFEIWGEQVARGDPFPVLGPGGAVSAYVFPYALGTRSFPDEERLVSGPTDPSARFGAIYVAARPTAQPILRVVHALHPLYLNGVQAEESGRRALAQPGARLSHMYWLGLHEEYFEVEAADHSVLLDVHTLEHVPREKALHKRAPVPEEDPTDRSLPDLPLTPTLPGITADGTTRASALKLVPLAECVPVVNWTYWCVPTAGTMVVTYYDNYDKATSGILGYGRLVGHWLDHPKSGHNVPDYIDQLIDPATGTWRTGFNGLTDFIKKTYGYTFTDRDVTANKSNDWAWADITGEIDAGRPFMWGTLVNGAGHAVCAFGYRITTNGKFVIVHTTWGDTELDQREEWAYTQGTGLKAIIPGGGTPGQHLVLWSPDGHESLLTNIAGTITWYVWGNQITRADVSASYDGGSTWSVVRQAAPCVPGWNICDWTPTMATERARVRVRGYDTAGAYVAGDGSQANVQITPGPRPVTLKTILVKATTDANGRFAAPHGLERYTPDGYAIRGITAAVQHANGNWHTLEFSHEVDNRYWWNKEIVGGIIASPSFANRPVQVLVFAESVVG